MVNSFSIRVSANDIICDTKECKGISIFGLKCPHNKEHVTVRSII